MKEDKTGPELTLLILCERFAICRLDKNAAIPNWIFQGNLYSVTRTQDELSIVCPLMNVPEGIVCDQGWSCLKVKGPLDLSLTGIISSITSTLERQNISLFAISTYDTDYIMVREQNLEKAIHALTETGHRFEWQQNE